MNKFFPNIASITYKGKNSTDPLSYRYYNAKQQVLGKSMEDHLRMAVCYWHTFGSQGADMFGQPTFKHFWHDASDTMKASHKKVEALFEFLSKLGLRFFTFHDYDIAPEGKTLEESNKNVNTVAEVILEYMQTTGKELLWGTANLFSNKRYMAGAATNPDPEIFAYAIGQVKNALDVTHRLNGHGYVLWGGREGYDTLLNTDLKKEMTQFGRFLSLLVDYKNKIGFKGQFLIEPKPCEPTKHQYDFDSAAVYAFLQKFDLEKEFRLNIEANHATLAGHAFSDEVAYALSNKMLGSIDANQGDAQLGWDTDEFPSDLTDLTLSMYLIMSQGGIYPGGFNFDAHLRRQSVDIADYFYAHILGIDTLARALLSAEKLIQSGVIKDFIKNRYAGWQNALGQHILSKKVTVEEITQSVLDKNVQPKIVSGRQELLIRALNDVI